MSALAAVGWCLQAHAAEVPYVRDLALDTPVVRMVAEQAWAQLPESPYRLWSRCDSTRTFLAAEVQEATDPLAVVCAEARDLARPAMPPLVRVERSGVAGSHLSLSTTLPTAARRRYLRAFDRALHDAARPGAPGENLWVSSQPGPSRIEAAFASVPTLAPDAPDCPRRYEWLAVIDAPRAHAVALDRISTSADRCGADLAGTLLAEGTTAEAIAARVRAAVARTPDLARTLPALAGYPEPVRVALAADVTTWQATVTTRQQAAAAARAALIAGLSPDARTCYDLVVHASSLDGVSLANAARAPALAAGRPAVWSVPHALTHATPLAHRVQIEDGHGGTAWMLDLPGGASGGALPRTALPRAAGTVDTVTVVTPDGAARPVPLLRVVCWPDVLVPAEVWATAGE